MRISKEPEVRKQEIIDTAMKVFAEKGYEAAAMKDIAAEMKIASGLCYHYFPNKQALYETAVRQYAEACSRPFIEIFKQTRNSLKECMEQMGTLWLESERKGTYAYESFFHKKGNELFHKQLDLEMIKEILPYAVSYLEARKQQNEIKVTDAQAAAVFILNGEVALINNHQMSLEKRLELAQEFVIKVLQ